MPDERLKLLFVCAHPSIDRGLHTPLMLQTVLGLEAVDIARAFLVSPTAMAQRLVRAKRKIRDADLINYATHLLSKAQKLKHIGRFQIEAAIQSVHAHRADTGVTDWQAIVQLYSALMKFYPTIGSAVAHAAAVGEAFGPEQGIALLDRIEAKRRQSFQPALVTRAHLLSKTDPVEACALYTRAIDLTTEPPLRQFLTKTRDALIS